MTAGMSVMQLLPLLLGETKRTQHCSRNDCWMIVMRLLPLLLGKQIEHKMQ
jgi:hypothetical protein